MNNQKVWKVDSDGWTIVPDGETISPKKGDKFKVLEGTVTVSNQTGGDCSAFGNATLNSENQTGGYCGAFGNATLNQTP